MYKTPTICPCAVVNRWSQSWRGVICVSHVSAQSRHDSGVCTCLDESGLCLSILVYLLGLIFVFSSSLVSFFYFSMLLLLFFRSLVRLASLSSLFSLFGHVSPCSARWPVLRRVVLRRSACSPFGLAALFCVAWVGRVPSLHCKLCQPVLLCMRNLRLRNLRLRLVSCVNLYYA